MMGPRGAPARQYASSTLTPWERSLFKALLQLSLPPWGVTRTMARGALKKSNLCRISPIWAKKLCTGTMWSFLKKETKTEVMELLLTAPEDTAVHCWAGGWRRHRSWLWADLMDRKLVLDPVALTKPLNTRDRVWITNIPTKPWLPSCLHHHSRL